MGNFEKLGILVIMVLVVTIVVLCIWGMKMPEPEPVADAGRTDPISAVTLPRGGGPVPQPEPGPSDLVEPWPKPTPEPVDDDPAPPSPAPSPPAPAPSPSVVEHVVKRGEGFYAIARQYYGDGSRWKEIHAANPQVRDPNALAAGTVLKIPAAGSAPAPRNDPVAPPAPGRTCTVLGGDSLARIATRELGAEGRWREIYELNREVIGADPTAIRPGMVLRLP